MEKVFIVRGVNYTSEYKTTFEAAKNHAQVQAAGNKGKPYTIFVSVARVTVKAPEPVYETIIETVEEPTCTSRRGDQ